jgi:hypothetical protein
MSNLFRWKIGRLPMLSGIPVGIWFGWRPATGKAGMWQAPKWEMAVWFGLWDGPYLMGVTLNRRLRWRIKHWRRHLAPQPVQEG